MLESEAGKKLLDDATYVKVGRFQNVLVKTTTLEPQTSPAENSVVSPPSTLTVAARRELANSHCLGGLRDPQAAVVKSWKLRQVGARLRSILDTYLTTDVTRKFEAEPRACPFESKDLRQVRQAVANEFGAGPLSTMTATKQTCSVRC